MPARDFFTFCTSLKPLELKALGALSHVRHVAEGETVYAVKDPAEALYIINRGVVEVVKPESEHASAYLVRGDVFGDVEVLLQLPREQLARGCEPVSLQCFRTEDLDELLQRVPAFFRYLYEQAALRLLHAREQAGTQSRSLQLSGSLANFDLVTVYQTIVNSSQTGELTILDEKGGPISAFFFEAGQPRRGRFGHLTGEEAFWQLFLTENLRGTFSFHSAPEGTEASAAPDEITRNATDMLIHAMQGRDEFHALRSKMPGLSTLITRQKQHLRHDQADVASATTLMEQIWQQTETAPVRLPDLFSECSVSELKLYRAVQTLVSTGHFTLSEAERAQKVG